VGADLLGWSTL